MRRNIDRWRSLLSRLSRENTIWIATVRPDGRPHMTPVWFIWLEDKVYIATGSDTRKFANLRLNQKVALSLPDTDRVIIIEGEAHVADYRTADKLADYFYNKYEWDYNYDDAADWRLIEITPHRVLAWGDEYDYEGIRVM